ncbi:hypothetical protein DF186_25180, partial [Enterococcus hirae]
SFFSGNGTVNLDDALISPETVANAPTKIGERVLELAEDDEFSAVSVLVDHQRVVENCVELVPLGVLAGADHASG